jgi:hypothetical protein
MEKGKMRQLLFVTSLLTLICVWSFNANAVPGKKALDRDCTPEKAAKNTVMKATVGVGGPCGPADAAKDTAKDAVGLDGKKHKKQKKKDKKKKNKKHLKN